MYPAVKVSLSDLLREMGRFVLLLWLPKKHCALLSAKSHHKLKLYCEEKRNFVTR